MMVRARVVLAVVVCAGVGAPARAQISPEGSIRGYVKDEQSAVLPGVTLTATSPTVAGTFTTASEDEGHYRLINLPPGEYTLRADLQGFAGYSREGIQVRAGLNLSVDITMQVGSLTETVEVKLDTPAIETLRPVQAFNITGGLQRALPLSSRSEWSSMLALVPGMTNYASSVYSSSYYSHGADAGSQVIQIDGADVASSQQSSTLYVALNTDAIADVQVKTAGVDAASPLGQGAVISVVTPSGTNQLRGSASITYQNQRWSSNNNPGGTTTAASLIQSDVSVGGPIRRNRMWFFGAYRHTRNQGGLSRSANELATLTALNPTFRPFDLENRATYLFTKATVHLGPNQQLSGFHQYDTNPQESAGPTSGAAFYRTLIGGSAYSVKLASQWSPAFSTTATLSYNNKTFPIRRFSDDSPSREVHRSVFASSGRLVGSGTIAVLDNTTSGTNPSHDKLTVALDAVHHRRDRLGLHQLQMGMYLQPRSRGDITASYTNGGFTLEQLVLRDPSDLTSSLVPFHRRIYDLSSLHYVSTTSSDLALYLSDTVALTSRLTASAGFRLDRVTSRDRLFDVELQRSVDIGPRLGATYMLTPSGRSVLRASWGRVHEGLSATKQTAGASSAGFVDSYDLNLDGTFETSFITPATTALSTNRILAEDLHQPHAAEWLVGLKTELPRRFSADVSVVRRSYKELLTLVETNGIYSGGRFAGYTNPALNEVYLVTNNRWNTPVYTSAGLTLTRRSARMELVASYTRQWRHISGGWAPNDPGGIIQPEAFPNNKGIGWTRSASAADANSLSGTNMAGAVQWRDHAIRAGAAFTLPWRASLAMNYTFQSGLWSGPIVTRLPAGDPRFGPPTVTLSSGRRVSNPLATPLRFAHATRGDGQFTLGNLHALNVRAARTFDIGLGDVQIMADVFNVTNAGGEQLLATGANQLFSPNYGLGRQLQLPRSVVVGCKFVF